MEIMEQTECQKCRRMTRIRTQGRLRHSSVSRHHDAQLMTESVIDEVRVRPNRGICHRF